MKAKLQKKKKITEDISKFIFLDRFFYYFPHSCQVLSHIYAVWFISLFVYCGATIRIQMLILILDHATREDALK